MCLKEVNCPSEHDKLLQKKPGLRDKLVLHRGYHEPDAAKRPLENTRQAYLDGARAGACFAECDVRATKDGVLVLCHDASFRAAAARPDERAASLPIAELDWSELSSLRLKNDSTPVMLETVLKDLQGASMQLVIELKTSACAGLLAAYLEAHPELVSSVGWVMSFSLDAVQGFQENGGNETGCRTAWILDNPVVQYDAAIKEEGETTYDCASEGFGDFLGRLGLKERWISLRCGLYLQYNPNVEPRHFAALRTEVCDLLCEVSTQPFEDTFLGLWNDDVLGLSFDRADVLIQWIDVVDVVNTDLPRFFWDQPALSSSSSSLCLLADKSRKKMSPRSSIQSIFTASGSFATESTVGDSGYPSASDSGSLDCEAL